MRSDLISSHLTSSHLISPHLISSHLISLPASYLLRTAPSELLSSTSYSLLLTSHVPHPTSYFLLVAHRPVGAPLLYFLLPTSHFLLPTSPFLLPTCCAPPRRSPRSERPPRGARRAGRPPCRRGPSTRSTEIGPQASRPLRARRCARRSPRQGVGPRSRQGSTPAYAHVRTYVGMSACACVSCLYVHACHVCMCMRVMSVCACEGARGEEGSA